MPIGRGLFVPFFFQREDSAEANDRNRDRVLAGEVAAELLGQRLAEGIAAATRAGRLSFDQTPVVPAGAGDIDGALED